MSFFEQVFSGIIAGAILENRTERKKAKEWNILFDKLLLLQDDMEHFLVANNVGDTLCILDTDVLKEGEAGLEFEKARLDDIKSKISSFIALGGNPSLIVDYTDIDYYLAKIELIKEKDLMQWQDDFIYLESPLFEHFEATHKILYNKTLSPIEKNRNLREYLNEQRPIICERVQNTVGKEREHYQTIYDNIEELYDIVKLC